MGKYIKEKGEKMSTDINTTNPYKRYEATVWRNDETLINQERLNKIEEGIVKGLRKFQIAQSINKSPSTVAKEIKRNRPKNRRKIFRKSTFRNSLF